MANKRPILITAGGTGGHVYPGLAVARYLLKHDIPIVWMGTRKGLEARVIPEAGLPMAWLEVSALRGKGLLSLLSAPWNLLKALYQSFRIMREHKPAAVLGMGGFVAGPGGLVAALMGIPVIIHEQNAVPGLTNKLLSRLSKRVLEGFPGTFKHLEQAQATGNPVRQDIASLSSPSVRLVGRETDKVRVLIVGGSLGAQALNHTVPQALKQLPEAIRPTVYHQAGTRNIEDARQQYQQAGITADVEPFIEDMAEAYAWADLVICRAGALTVAELAAAGVGSILVPYPYAVDDHQTQNAHYLANHEAAILVNQDNLTPEWLAQQLESLCTRRAKLIKMGIAARAVAKPLATQQVAAICASYAGYDLKTKENNE